MGLNRRGEEQLGRGRENTVLGQSRGKRRRIIGQENRRVVQGAGKWLILATAVIDRRYRWRVGAAVIVECSTRGRVELRAGRVRSQGRAMDGDFWGWGPIFPEKIALFENI